MKRLFVSLLTSCFVFSMPLTVVYAIHEIIPSETQVPEPGPDAEKLNEYIVKYNPYRAWDLWPKKGKLYKGTEPHGALLTTFVNDTALHSIRKKKGMAGNPDIDFLAMMIPHHEGAIEMARLVLIYGTDPLVRKLAEDIIATQRVEIETMKQRLIILRKKPEPDPGDFPAIEGTRGTGNKN
ncbi:MAG: DUF305 domain-containing protein [Nitrospirota bacterium]